MKRTVAVSVVIPAFNGSATVLLALESVERQTWQAEEVIVVDDGSTDNTAELVEQFINSAGGAKWRLLRQVNRGPSAARDAGIRASTCEYIALLDSDDTWSPAKLERSFTVMKRLNVDLIGAGLRAAGKNETDRVLSKSDFLYRNPYFTSTVMFKRTGYASVGGFDLHQRYSEDYKLWLQFVFSGYSAGLMREPGASYGDPRHPLRAPRGLSSQLFAMERGELNNYISLRRLHLMPLADCATACAWSLVKFGRRLLRQAFRRWN